ncbi:MAG: hypothetical protein J0H64_05180 [Actinobacteria bacterium]|nr:hypothetical protein [Actinomycetota bacterium]
MQIADNKLTSGKNGRSKTWCAVNVEVGLNIIRFRFAAYTNYGAIDYPNTTDFFWVKGSGTC